MAEFAVKIGNKTFFVDVTSNSEIIIDGKSYYVDFTKVRNNTFSLIFDNKVYEINFNNKNVNHYNIECNNQTYELTIEDEQEQLLHSLTSSIESEHKEIFINAPMPGLVLKIEVEVGQKIEPGAGLIILEAMKMENEIRSTASGTVKEISVKEKSAVEKGETLIVLE